MHEESRASSSDDIDYSHVLEKGSSMSSRIIVPQYPLNLRVFDSSPVQVTLKGYLRPSVFHADWFAIDENDQHTIAPSPPKSTHASFTSTSNSYARLGGVANESPTRRRKHSVDSPSSFLFSHLPTDCVFEILSFVPYSFCQLRLRRVCRLFDHVIRQPAFVRGVAFVTQLAPVLEPTNLAVDRAWMMQNLVNSPNGLFDVRCDGVWQSLWWRLNGKVTGARLNLRTYRIAVIGGGGDDLRTTEREESDLRSSSSSSSFSYRELSGIQTDFDKLCSLWIRLDYFAYEFLTPVQTRLLAARIMSDVDSLSRSQDQTSAFRPFVLRSVRSLRSVIHRNRRAPSFAPDESGESEALAENIADLEDLVKSFILEDDASQMTPEAFDPLQIHDKDYRATESTLMKTLRCLTRQPIEVDCHQGFRLKEEDECDVIGDDGVSLRVLGYRKESLKQGDWLRAEGHEIDFVMKDLLLLRGGGSSSGLDGSQDWGPFEKDFARLRQFREVVFGEKGGFLEKESLVIYPVVSGSLCGGVAFWGGMFGDYVAGFYYNF